MKGAATTNNTQQKAFFILTELRPNTFPLSPLSTLHPSPSIPPATIIPRLPPFRQNRGLKI